MKHNLFMCKERYKLMKGDEKVTPDTAVGEKPNANDTVSKVSEFLYNRFMKVK